MRRTQSGLIVATFVASLTAACTVEPDGEQDSKRTNPLTQPNVSGVQVTTKTITVGGKTYSSKIITTASPNCTEQLLYLEYLVAPPAVPSANDLLGDSAFHSSTYRDYCPTTPNNPTIPPAVDITSVQVTQVGSRYDFRVNVAGPDLLQLMTSRQCGAQIAIHIDSDKDGVSDWLLTTTTTPTIGKILNTTFDGSRPIAMPYIAVSSTYAVLSAPVNLITEQHAWVAVAGYSPVAGCYFPTPVTGVCSLPVVDVLDPLHPKSGIVTSYGETGSLTLAPAQCQTFGTKSLPCPPPPGGLIQNMPGGGGTGVRLYTKTCGGNVYEIWCPGAFATRVVGPTKSGWIGRCPWTGGVNGHEEVFLSSGIWDRVRHTSMDGGSDDDVDGLRDTMSYGFSYFNEGYTIYNEECPANGNCAYTYKTPPPQQPYTIWDQVPRKKEEF